MIYKSHLSLQLVLIAFFCIGITYAFQNITKTTPAVSKAEIEIEIQRRKIFQIEDPDSYDEAISSYQNLLRKCKQKSLNNKISEIYKDIFSVIILRHDFELEEKLTAIQNLYNKEQSNNIQAIYQGALAHLYAFYEQVDSMSKYYDLANQQYLEEGQYSLQANINNKLAFEMYFLEDLVQAEFFIEKSEKIAEEHPINVEVYSDILNFKSIICSELGQDKKAIDYCLAYISFLENDSLSFPSQLSSAYNNLATFYSNIGDNNNAIAYYQKGIHLDNSYATKATAHHNIGITYASMGEYHHAKKNLILSLYYLDKEEIIEVYTYQDYINNYVFLADLYLHEQNIDSAEYCILKAKKHQKNIDYRVAIANSCHARIYLEKGQYKLAEKELDNALRKSLDVYGEKHDFTLALYKNYANLFQAKGELNRALFYCQKALEAMSLDFADTEGVSNPKLKNIRYKDDLMEILNIKLDVMKELELKGIRQFEINDFYATAQLATKALETVNRSMKSKDSKQLWLTQRAIPTFKRAIDVAVSAYYKTKNKKYLNAAFQLSENSKSMLMMEVMQENNASAFGGVPDSLILKEQKLKEQIAKAHKGLLDARLSENTEAEKTQDSLLFIFKHRSDVLKHTFETDYPKYHALKYESKVASIKEIQQTIDDQTILIEYFEGINNIYVFSISKDQQKVDTISKDKHYETKMINFLLGVSSAAKASEDFDAAYDEFIDLSFFLYNKLLANSLQENKSRLIIIPDGQISYLPFEILIQKQIAANTEPSEKSYTNLPYIIRDYKVSYNYSGTLLLSQKEANKKIINGNVLAMAPSYSFISPNCRSARELKIRKGLIELPGAIQEVDLLRKKYNGVFLEGKDANEQAFKESASNYGILHLAMHGLVDKEHTEFSGLAFTENMECSEDNFLYAFEIKQQELQAGLVVLSACETGIGKYQKGEGIVSIGRSFMYAGTPSLMMTLWSLNDQSGAFIIEHFYDNMNKGMDKDEAIRQAKLTYLDGIEGPALAFHPFLWAAFIQVGDYSPIVISEQISWLTYTIGIGILSVLMYLLWLYYSIKRNASNS